MSARLLLKKVAASDMALAKKFRPKGGLKPEPSAAPARGTPHPYGGKAANGCAAGPV